MAAGQIDKGKQYYQAKQYASAVEAFTKVSILTWTPVKIAADPEARRRTSANAIVAAGGEGASARTSRMPS
jgi:hypothetical protein